MPGRRRAKAFWHLGPERLVAAVLEPTADEPLLRACTVVEAAAASAGPLFAPGLLETALVLGSRSLANLAALDDVYARVIRDDDEQDVAPAGRVSGAAPPQATMRVQVQGADGWCVEASGAAVEEARRLFEEAHLKLVSLDCYACALANLGAVLGDGEPSFDAAPSGSSAAALDPLAAVSVTPEAEDTAVALGPLLTVPVGLALAAFDCLGVADAL